MTLPKKLDKLAGLDAVTRTAPPSEDSMTTFTSGIMVELDIIEEKINQIIEYLEQHEK